MNSVILSWNKDSFYEVYKKKINSSHLTWWFINDDSGKFLSNFSNSKIYRARFFYEVDHLKFLSDEIPSLPDVGLNNCEVFFFNFFCNVNFTSNKWIMIINLNHPLCKNYLQSLLQSTMIVHTMYYIVIYR